MTSVKQDFSTLLSLTTLSLIILCCGGCPVHWTVFNVISVLCPSDVSSTPSVATTRMSSDITTYASEDRTGQECPDREPLLQAAEKARVGNGRLRYLGIIYDY